MSACDLATLEENLPDLLSLYSFDLLALFFFFKESLALFEHASPSLF